MSGSAHPNDPRVKFTNLDTGEEKVFEYRWPYTDVTAGSRTTTHECIGTQPVIQHLGPKAKQVEFRCHCYYDEATFLEGLPEASRVRVRSHREQGFYVVTDVSTTQTGEGGGHRDGNENRVLDYRVTVVKTDAP